MKFFRITLERKIFFIFGALAALGIGGFYLLREKAIFDFRLISFVFGGTLLIALSLYWWLFSRPLYTVLRQMEGVLTGRPYKKIYTDRVDEIGVLAHFFNEVTRNLSSFTAKLQEGERMAGELSLAAQLQRSILPLSAPIIPGLLVTAKTRPAAEVGGDNFDFLTVGNRTFFYLGDVTGHGVPAGLIMSMVNMLIYTYAELYENSYDIVVNVNRQLKRRIQATRFMTMVMMKWDHEKKKLSYVGAGHEHILVFRPKTGTVDVIRSGGIALGMVPDNSKLVQEIPLELTEGDTVLLYSDGITEAKNMNGEMFGLSRLQESFQRYSAQYNPEGVAQHIADDLGHFVQGHQPEDDMSLIIVKYIGDQTVEQKDRAQETGWQAAV